MSLIIPKNHISLTSSTEVADICQPLFDNFGLKLFVYNRSYINLQPGERHGFALFSHPEWTEFFFTNDYKHRLTFGGIEAYDSLDGYRLIMMSSFPENEMIKNLREYYDIDYGIIVAKQYPDYVEWCSFGAARNNTSILHFYINQFDQLIKFITYFKQKAKHLIKQANKERMMLPDVDDSQRIHMRSSVQEALWDKNIDSFTKEIKLKKYHIEIDNNSYEFTAREMDTLYYLKQGKTAKIMALRMDVSPRTVEYHLENIRNKLDCDTKNEILEMLGDSINFYTP